MDVWQSRSQRVTYVLLVTSAVLIGPGLAGFGASPALAGVLAVLGASLLAARDRIERLPTVVGYDLGWYGRDSWLGCLLGVVVVLVYLGASPAETRALGGIAGLLGMLNYFVRPLYLFVASTLRNLARRV